MIYGNNHNDKKQRAEINELVGIPYGFIERLKLGGNGSPRLSVDEYSPQLKLQFGESAERKFINIELRKKGILIYFRNHVNNYVWPIPYYQLSIFQSGTFNIHAHGLFIKIHLDTNSRSSNIFIKKMLKAKAEFAEMHLSPDQVEFTSSN